MLKLKNAMALRRIFNNKHYANRCVHFMKKTSACYLSTTQIVRDKTKLDFDLADFPPENIRNFSIIAHVDHGKSTLADRLLENAGVISKSSKNKQVLDRLQVEKERGITVKAQTASLVHTYNGTRYLLNLVDTPGHVDFNYEVSRSLTACEGVILLVDANQGVQAQTVANFFLAFEKDLTIIPVLNKIDLPNAQPDMVIQQMHHLFETQPEDVLQISAKTGVGVKDVMDAIIERIPAPRAEVNKPFKGLLFDSWFNKFRGVVVNVAVLEGVVRKGDKIQSHFHKKTYEIGEIGLMYPTELPTDVLYAGQVGYIIANIKNIKDTRVGDTIYHKDKPVEPLPGFKPAKPMVFAGIFPSDQSEYNYVQAAIEKLTLNDSSVDVHVDSSAALGQGWRLGFLGLLHMDVFIQRLYQEHNFSVIVTAPNVPFKVKIFGEKNIKFYKTDILTILNPCTLPETSIIERYEEPMVKGTIIAPHEYLQVITELCLERRGTFPDSDFIDDRRVMITSILPLTEIVVDFFDELKSLTSGYASFDYDDHGYQETDLEKVHFMLNGKVIDELTMLLHTSKVDSVARRVCLKLKDSIQRHLFLIAIQAGRGKKIICRENIKPLKKDVTAKCYGGDQSRKLKLLKQQSEGKKLMRQIGNIEVTKDAFISVLKK